MTKDPIQNITDAREFPRLSLEEREQSRAALARFMEEHPLPTMSPYVVRSHWLPRQLTAVLAMFVLMVGAFGASISHAADGAMPGDSLYGIKVSFNEPLMQLFSFGAANKAQTDTALVERRLSEAETLMARKTLSANTSLQLIAAIRTHADAAYGYLDEAAENGQLADAVEAGSQLQNIFEAHSEVLSSIAEGSDGATTSEATTLIDAAQDNGTQARKLTDSLEVKLVSSFGSSTKAEAYLESTLTRSQNEVKNAAAQLPNARPSTIGRGMLGSASRLLKHTENYYSVTADNVEAGNVTAAAKALRNAMQSAQQANILIQSNEQFGGQSAATSSEPTALSTTSTSQS